MESRLPFRLDKGAGEGESYMCRGVEAITPKGNGVEDEEEWSRGKQIAAAFVQGAVAGYWSVTEAKEGPSAVRLATKSISRMVPFCL